MRWIVWLIPFCLTPLAHSADRPNLIVMMTDDQRADALSCAGNPIIKTPNMDRIGKEGAICQNMFVTNSLCAPSRATLLTGLYSHANGVLDNSPKRPDVPATIPLVSDILRKEGYEVAFCGKSHQKSSLRDRQWDYYFDYKDQGNYLKPVIAEGTDGKDTPYTGWIDDVVTDKAIAWMKKKREKPFCLFLFFKSPHRSWVRPPRYADLFKDVEIKKPALWEADRNSKPSAFYKADNKIGSFDDVKTYEKFITDYYATITGVDDNVGKVLDTLKEMNQLDNTAIFYTSDNGFFAGEWQAFDKRFMHEVSIRVPMLVRYPKLVKPGSTPKEMILNIDIAPTLLDLAGVKEIPKMHGRSFIPVLKGEAKDWRKDWLYSYYEYPGPHSVQRHRGIRTESWKLIHYYTQKPEEFELYNLEKDPQETTNLYGRPEYEEITKKLKERLKELRKEVNEPD